MARNDYGPLRDAHQKALDATSNHARQADEPTRPEADYRQPRAWTADGGMIQQQTSAMEWARATQQARENALARQEERETPEERVDPAKAGQAEVRGHEAVKGEMTDAKAARITQIEVESRRFEEAEKARQDSQDRDRGERSL
jgi:hypothetical protein